MDEEPAHPAMLVVPVPLADKRDHLFKVCPEWKMQQKILWADVKMETERWKSRWTDRDLLADGRCGQAVLDFLSSTDVGRLVPALEGGDARSEVSEWERRERREWEEEREVEAEEVGAVGKLGAGEELPLFLPTWHRRTRSRGWVSRSLSMIYRGRMRV